MKTKNIRKLLCAQKIIRERMNDTRIIELVSKEVYSGLKERMKTGWVFVQKPVIEIKGPPLVYENNIVDYDNFMVIAIGRVVFLGKKFVRENGYFLNIPKEIDFNGNTICEDYLK